MAVTDVREARWEPDYKEIVERAGDAIYTLDLEGRFTWGNAAGLSYLGYDEDAYDQFLGTHFIDLLPPESQRVAVEHFTKALAGEAISPFFEVQAYKRDGTLMDAEIRASDLYVDGELVGRQGVVRNISDLKALQAQVAETSARLSLLEERERIAGDLYNRLSALTFSASDPTEMKAVRDALMAVTAERLGLSRSDLPIVALLAQGRTNADIAAEVHLSPHTVKDRVGRILKALGARTRAEAAANAARHGLLSDVEPPAARPR